MDGLELAIDTFTRTYGKKKVTKRIFLITDGESPALESKVNNLSNLINENDIRLNIM